MIDHYGAQLQSAAKQRLICKSILTINKYVINIISNLHNVHKWGIDFLCCKLAAGLSKKWARPYHTMKWKSAIILHTLCAYVEIYTNHTVSFQSYISTKFCSGRFTFFKSAVTSFCDLVSCKCLFMRGKYCCVHIFSDTGQLITLIMW